MGSGRCVVTGKKGEISTAAVATWVVPASTDPPSVAVAIAKDHPLQSLLQIGDKLVVNMLEESNYLDVMKHFQKDIMPGDDSFEGVGTSLVNIGDGEATGIAVTGCCAYLTLLSRRLSLASSSAQSRPEQRLIRGLYNRVRRLPACFGRCAEPHRYPGKHTSRHG